MGISSLHHAWCLVAWASTLQVQGDDMTRCLMFKWIFSAKKNFLTLSNVGLTKQKRMLCHALSTNTSMAMSPAKNRKLTTTDIQLVDDKT